MTNRRSTSTIAALTLVAALVLGACGTSGGDKTNDASGKTTTTAASGNTGSKSTEGSTDKTTTTEKSASASKGAVDVGSDGQAYVDAMVAGMTNDETVPISKAQAECFSSRTVKTIGVDNLKAAGITPEAMGSSSDTSLDLSKTKLSVADANKVYDHFGECGVDLRDMMMQSFSKDESITPEIKACFEGALSEKNLRALMVVTMTKGSDAVENDPALKTFMGSIMGCAFMGMADSSTTTPAG